MIRIVRPEARNIEGSKGGVVKVHRALVFREFPYVITLLAVVPGKQEDEEIITELQK